MDEHSPVEKGSKVPYRVEVVGVTCDPGLAVARGIWRQVRLLPPPCRCCRQHDVQAGQRPV